MSEDKSSKHQKNKKPVYVNPRAIVALFITCFFIAIALMAYLVRNKELLQNQEVFGRCYFISLLSLGISAAAGLLGVLQLPGIRATVVVRQGGLIVQLGGPVAICALVVYGGFYLPNEYMLPMPNLKNSPFIRITQVPIFDPRGGASPSGNIGGEVVNLDDPSDYAVVVYAYTDQWHIQPMPESARLGIDPANGRWTSSTHLGAKYAALLVKTNSFSLAVSQYALPAKSQNIQDISEVEGTQ